MGNLFQDATNYLINMVTRTGGVSLVYKRGEQSTVLTAVPSEIIVRSDSMPTDGGFFGKVLRRYIIAKDNLRFDPKDKASLFLPEVGDVIEEADGEKYRVNVFQGETAWNYHDVNKIIIEFHAEKIGHADKTKAGRTGTGTVEKYGESSGGSSFFP